MGQTDPATAWYAIPMQWADALFKLTPIASTLLAAACSAPESAAVPLSEASVEQGQFFPAYLATTARGCSYPANSNPPILSDFVTEWYSAHLLAAGEPPLVELARVAPRQLHVRFLWLRSFDEPVVVRVHGLAKGGATFEAKRLSGTGGYEPGEIAERVNRALTAAEYREFEEVFAASSLAHEPAANCQIGMDGAQWILEVVSEGQYFFLERWSPDSGPVRDVASKMLKLTGWNLESIY